MMDMYKDSDIKDLVLLCREHNDLAFDELVRRYTPMIHKVVLSFGKTACDYSELFSEGCVALHIAAQRFDIEQTDVTFGLYARICVRNRVVDLLRLADTDTVSELDIEMLADDDDTVEERIADREMFDILMSSAKNLLSDYEYRVLMLHIQGYKTAQIATALSRSAKSVDNAKSRLFRRLRAEVGDISNI